MGTNKKYSKEFKQEVLSMVAAVEWTVSQIEVWYNRQGRHSALGYLSPCAFEQLARP